MTMSRALDIADEIAEECAYKLRAALRPPRDARPAGSSALAPLTRT